MEKRTTGYFLAHWSWRRHTRWRWQEEPGTAHTACLQAAQRAVSDTSLGLLSLALCPDLTLTVPGQALCGSHTGLARAATFFSRVLWLIGVDHSRPEGVSVSQCCRFADRASIRAGRSSTRARR